MELWKSVKDYEGYYEVSTDGRIRSVDRVTNSAIKNNTHVIKKGRMLKLNLKRDGYLSVDLSKENIKKTKHIHQLIAITFIPNTCDKPVVNHINAIKTDNRVENLEWVTHKENSQHASSLGLMYGGLRKSIKCVETGDIFTSSYKAAEFLNSTKYNYSKNVGGMGRNIRACCAGKRNSAFGYRWKDV